MKLYDGGITILLGILLLGSVISDKFEKKQDRKELKTHIDNSVKLSATMVSLSSNNMETSKELNKLIVEKTNLDKKYEGQLKEQEKKTGEQLGILAAQASDIYSTTPAADTLKHFDTVKVFMQLHGGTIADQQLSWNTSFINSSTKEYEILKKELEITRRENEKLSTTLQKESDKNVNLSTQLNSKSLELEKTIGKVSLTETLLYSQKGWAQKLKSILYTSIILTIIGGIIYVMFHVWQLRQKNKDIVDIREKLREEAERRRLANKEKYEKEAQANELKNAAKIFMSTDKTGNQEFKRILRSNGLKKHFVDFKDIEGKTIDED